MHVLGTCLWAQQQQQTNGILFLYLLKQQEKLKIYSACLQRQFSRVTQSLLLPLRILIICFQQNSLHRLTHSIFQTANNAVHNVY